VSALRALLVGAERRRQGTGPFVLDALLRAGVAVPAIVGSSEQSVQLTVERLQRSRGLRLQGYHQLGQALAEQAPDLVALCSPYRLHHDQLRLIAEAGCHCLSEKPLWWTPDGESLRAGTRDIVEAFASRKRLLETLTQWPYALGAWDQLYGRHRRGQPGAFEMWLTPMTRGADTIPDCAPHVFSMLLSLAGVGEVEDARVWNTEGSAPATHVRFGYRHDRGRIQVRATFQTGHARPHPAAFAIDSLRVDRVVRLPGYRIAFAAGGREIPVDDPLEALVVDFVRGVALARPTHREKLASSMDGLARLAEAARTMQHST
jgi:hypothetical protein